MSIVLTSHHFTFLWGPLLILSSYSLSYGPYSKMYSISVPLNAVTFCSLFVWYCKSLNQRYTSKQKSKEDKKPLHLIWNVLLFTFAIWTNGRKTFGTRPKCPPSKMLPGYLKVGCLVLASLSKKSMDLTYFFKGGD